MARLSKQGNEIIRLGRGAQRYSFRDNGSVLHRSLGVWKICMRKATAERAAALRDKLLLEGYAEVMK